MKEHPATNAYNAEFVVASKDYVAERVVLLTLQNSSPDGRVPAWSPGAHIDVAIPGGLVRQYSLCGDPGDNTRLRIAVLREPESRGGSRFIHENTQVGQQLQIVGLRNNFPLVSSKRYIFVAGGIGITPIIPMIAAADRAGAEWQLLYGGHKRASMAFLDTLRLYNGKLQIAPQDEVGLLDLAKLLTEVQTDCAVYCCGPEGLLQAVEAQCEHWPNGSLHIERFKPKEGLDANSDAEFEVELHRSGKTLSVPKDKTIIQVLEEAGIETLHSCLEGICGTCETRVLSGIPDHRDSVLTSEERKRTSVMICVSRSLSKRLTLDI